MADALRERYVLEHELGRGGMATIYLARDLRHHRAVAVKVLHPEIAHALGGERFLREIETAACLRHPHIMPLFDSGEAGGLLYYVMPYAEGESLRTRLTREKQLRIDDALEVARQVASALAYAHGRGIVHRDIKPENILLEADQAVVADFGIASALHVSGGERLTGTGLAIGTPAYMSPEQASGEHDLDARSDQYSLGCVLYEMLAGQAPFLGVSPQQVMARHATDPVPPLRTARPSVPQALEQAVTKSLAKVPADRFVSVAHFSQALAQVGKQLSSTTGVSGEARSTGSPPARSRPRVRASRFAVVCVLLAVIAGGIATFPWRGDSSASGSVGERNVQLTFVGNVDQQDISPDGKLLAFVERGDTFRLIVKDLLGGSIIPLANTGTASPPPIRWTRDGSAILYTVEDSLGRPSLPMLVPRLGGTPRPLPGRGYYSVLSPDGSRQAVWLGNADQPIRVTNLATAESRSIPVPNTLHYIGEGDWSPDGRMIALISVDKGPVFQRTLWTIDLARDQWQKVLSDTTSSLAVRWSPSGDALYYLGPDELRKVPMKSNGLRRGAIEVVQPRLGASYFSISGDGRKLAYTKAQQHSNLWLATRLRKTTEFTGTQITRGTAIKSLGSFSPDGGSIAFVQHEGDKGDVFTIAADGGVPRRVTSSGTAYGTPAWSPDGSRLAFSSHEGGRHVVRIIRTDGSEERRFARAAASLDLVWAPFPRILYQRSGNRNFHWLDPSTEAEEPLVSNDSVGWMFNPSPSPDGGTLAIFWNRPADRRAYLISLKDASQRAVGPINSGPIGWSADGALLYVQDDQRRIWGIPVDGRKGMLVGTIPFKDVDPSFVTSCLLTERPSGLRLLCSVPESVSDVWMIEDFDPTPTQ